MIDRQELIQALQDPEVVMLLHRFSDVDRVNKSIHHTLGGGPLQSPPGNHIHDGEATSSVPPPGTVCHFSGDNIPIGYLFCDGSAISRTKYAALFKAIGTKFGVGDGSTTFNIPDLRNTFIMGALTTGGTTGGSNSHTHGGSTGGTSLAQQTNTTASGVTKRLTDPDTHSHSIPSDNNLPPYLTLRAVIKI